MPKTAKPKSANSTETDRREALHRLWLAVVHTLAQKLEQPATEVDAATLTAGIRMLAANHIDTESLKAGTGDDPRSLDPAELKRQSDYIAELDREWGNTPLPAPDVE
jgi:hypothetical protein